MRTFVAIIIVAVVAYHTLPLVAWISALIGLLVGWNLIPQPQIVRDFWDKHIARLFDDA